MTDVVRSTEKFVGNTLPSLSHVRPLYFLPADPFADEVLIPGFLVAEEVNCMVGFFSSSVLAELAPGLATYIASEHKSFRLIISPFLKHEDQIAIEEGTRSPEDLVEDLLGDLTVTEDLLERHAVRCLSYLLRTGRIEIKIALMKHALFHPKVWIFKQNGNNMAVHGSSNLTHAGIRKNFEQVSVSRSWEDSNQKYIAEKFQEQFCQLWEDEEDDCIVLTVPQAVKDNVLSEYPVTVPPTESEYHEIYKRVLESGRNSEKGFDPLPNSGNNFHIPDSLRYEDGPYEHQGKAVAAWCNANFHGVLEMATGSGKTITSMICAYRLFKKNKPLLIVIAAPYVPLIEQWCDEVEMFGVKTVNLTLSNGRQGRARELQRLDRRLRTGMSEVELVVISHDTLCTSAFVSDLESITCNRLLIADEVHNLGRASFINNPPELFEHRLGLSATPVRQYDEEGTEALFEFFGPVVFEFSLEEAIGRCLVEYDYYVHRVHLTDEEMARWYELTAKIKLNAWRTEDSKPDEYLAKLFRDRRLVLETAVEKLRVFEDLLGQRDAGQIRHMLVYATDKAPQQLESVNALLANKGLLFHQLTADETKNRNLTKEIIRSFRHGDIQVITAKRVLDEGVNIPEISEAFILASTTVERQWVQRRGRLLRTCSSINKTHSIIHDFIVLPPDIGTGLDPEACELVKTEIRRVQEFARLARNYGREDGPLPIVDELVQLVYF